MPNARIDWKRPPAYATGFGNYTRLHYHDGTHVLIAYTLRVVLMRFTGLVRVHKICAVDPGYVKMWKRNGLNRSMRVYLNDGSVINVGRRRIVEIVKLLTNYNMSLDIKLFYPEDADEEVFSANYTHNIIPIANEAGLYEPLWRPDEQGWLKAGQLIEPITTGLQKLKADPAHFEQFNPPNGWGKYDSFVPWVEKYLAACLENPESEIYVSR